MPPWSARDRRPGVGRSLRTLDPPLSVVTVRFRAQCVQFDQPQSAPRHCMLTGDNYNCRSRCLI
jgi:hypothetical protein